MHLRSSIEHVDAEAQMGGLDLSYVDKDPLNYFLTPAPSSDDEAVDVMDFDAGIEDAKHPAPIVRSVSPSTLDGLSRLGARPPTPPRGPGSPSPELDMDMAPTPEEEEDDDDDGEEYLRLGGSLPLCLPFSLRDFAAMRAKGRRERESKAGNNGLLLSPAPLHAGHSSSARGRSAHRPGPRPIVAGSVKGRLRGMGLAPSRSSPHAWREPSPDVWSIEEEPEQEDGGGDMGEDGRKAGAIDIAAAKPRKKVRFVLPAREIKSL